MIVVKVHPGAGGRDSRDWARLLLAMEAAWAEQLGLHVVDRQRHDSFSAFGDDDTILQENGVHRLVRRSPFDFEYRRHTAFACVEAYRLTPETDPELDAQVPVGHINPHPITWHRDPQEPNWGAGPIRSYVLDPYTLAKDHRTNAQTDDVWSVLSGDVGAMR